MNFNSPIDVALVFNHDLEVSHVVISDNLNNRVQLFDENGLFIQGVTQISDPLGIWESRSVIWIISGVKKGLYRYYYRELGTYFDILEEMTSPYDFFVFYITDRGSHRIFRYVSTESY